MGERALRTKIFSDCGCILMLLSLLNGDLKFPEINWHPCPWIVLPIPTSTHSLAFLPSQLLFILCDPDVTSSGKSSSLPTAE